MGRLDLVRVNRVQHLIFKSETLEMEKFVGSGQHLDHDVVGSSDLIKAEILNKTHSYQVIMRLCIRKHAKWPHLEMETSSLSITNLIWSKSTELLRILWASPRTGNDNNKTSSGFANWYYLALSVITNNKKFTHDADIELDQSLWKPSVRKLK